MTWLLPPILGLIIGYTTNWLAIKMIFRPRKPIMLSGRRVPMTPGLFVARRAEFAKRLAESFVENFVSPDGIRNALEQAMKKNPEEQLAATSIGRVFVKRKLESLDLGEISEKAAELLKENSTIEEVISEKIESMNVDEVEEMVTKVSGKELKHLTVLGGLLGFLVGAVQSLLLWAAA